MIGEILVQLADREVKGEITIVVRGSSEGVQVAEEELEAAIRQLAEGGMAVKPIAEFLSQRYQLSKRKIYQMALQMKRSTKR
jgi:16S rRNA C1402 (ribose-2'-O) methylase RsmI